jgi:hypothetical protein
VTTSNEYFDKVTGKTYKPLLVYFRPADYYNPNGYYSKTYLLVYYDGYGYNFFTGAYGYYEYSINAMSEEEALKLAKKVMISAVCFLLTLVVLVLIRIKYLAK